MEMAAVMALAVAGVAEQACRRGGVCGWCGVLLEELEELEGLEEWVCCFFPLVLHTEYMNFHWDFIKWVLQSCVASREIFTFCAAGSVKDRRES